MLRIADFLARDFVAADPDSAGTLFLEMLVSGRAVVGMQANRFMGMLTLKDVVLKPGRMVVDLLTSRQLLDSSDEAFPVLLRMYENDIDFLPVGTNGVFEGVISRRALSLAHLRLMKPVAAADDLVKRLESDLALKNRLIAIVSHDINNMFNQVLGGLELLDKKLFMRDDMERRILQLARQSAQQVHSTLEGMLLWSRLASGAVLFQPQVLSLKDILNAVVNQFELACSVKEIQIRSQLRHEMNIRADRNMLNCILLNLVYNAIKFTPSGGSIRLDAGRKGDLIEISVADTGLGMTLTQKEEVFQEGKTTAGTLNEQGAGIGLVICRDFVERHDGQMHVESEQGKGTRVVISFPDR